MSHAAACPQVVFVHLPKTGGMSLHYAMERALGAERVLRIGDEAARNAFLAMDRAALSRFAFVSGHVTLNEALARSLPEARFVTVLRDPVARLVSAFNYMATWTHHPQHEAFKAKGFAEWVMESGDGLAGEACLQLTGAPHAAEAVTLLESCYAAVATQARVAELAALVARWLGLPPPDLQRENATPGQGRLTLDTPACETLLRVTRDDHALFDHVARWHGGLMVAPGMLS